MMPSLKHRRFLRGPIVWSAVTLLACPIARNADVNADGQVDALDVALVADCLGADLAARPECVPADTDRNGAVSQGDLDFVVARSQVPPFPQLVSSSPAAGETQVLRTAWLRLDFAQDVPLRALATVQLACGAGPLGIAAYRITPTTVAVNPNADLPAATDCELRWPGPAGSVAVGFRIAAAGIAAEVAYDRTDRATTAPFPDDYWLVPDPSTPTGSRVAIDVPDRESDVVNLFEALIGDTAVLDGFSPLALIAVELSDAPAPNSLPMTVEASLDPLATVALFDLTPGSPTLGQRVPFELHIRSDLIEGQSRAYTLVAFPSIPLTPGGRYGFIVTRRAFVLPSRTFEPSAFFRAVRDGETPGEDEAVTRARGVATDVFHTLVSNAFPPIPREDIALALRISVRSTADIPRDVLAMRQQVDAAPDPAVTVTDVDGGFAPTAAVVRGTWQAPNWRQSVFLVRDPAGVPRIVRYGPVPFVLRLPAAALTGPVPVTFYQHGNPGTAEEIAGDYVDDLLQAGFAVVGFTDPINRYFPQGAYSQLTGIFGTLLFTRHVPDFWVETYGEQIAFLRALESLSALDILPIGAPDGVPELDLQRPLTYRGVSQGSVHGQAFLAYAPEVKAAALLTGANRFMESLFLQDTTNPLDVGSFLEFISQQVPNVRPPDVWVGFSLFQMLYDRQDAHNHARFLFRNPLEIAGTTQKASVLVVEGIDDHFVPNNATRSLAWQLGPVPHLAPILESVPYLDAAIGELAGNVDADTTAAFVQYAPAGSAGLPPSPGCAGQGEGHFCGQLASSPQQIAFFLSALEAGAPSIRSTEADTDGDGIGDLIEPGYGTDPFDPDTDDDGFSDGVEIAVGFDPRAFNDPAGDYDADGLSNAEEVALGTAPFRSDTDSDRLSDGSEVAAGTDPLRRDTDGGGRGDGDEVSPDHTNPLDAADDLAIVTLPTDLFDGEGFRWDVRTNGSINNGSIDAYDGGLVLQVAGSSFPSMSSASTEDGDREIVLGPQPVGAVRVTRKVFVPNDQGFARFLEVLENPGAAPVTVRVRVATNLGSNFSTQLVATSSGDTVFTTADDYLVTDDADGVGDPTVAHVFSDAGATLQPFSVFSNAPNDSVQFEFDVAIAPGGTAAVLHYAVQASNRAQALVRADALQALQGRAVSGLSAAERSAIVNFAVP